MSQAHALCPFSKFARCFAPLHRIDSLFLQHFRSIALSCEREHIAQKSFLFMLSEMFSFNNENRKKGEKKTTSGRIFQ